MIKVNIMKVPLLRGDSLASKQSLISESVMITRVDIHPIGGKPDNTICAQSLRPYVRQPFTKSLRGRNRSSTLGIKSWFHSVRRPCRRPRLPHSPSNNHHRVAVIVQLHK
jgi:hypothetical protein